MFLSILQMTTLAHITVMLSVETCYFSSPSSAPLSNFYFYWNHHNKCFIHILLWWLSWKRSVKRATVHFPTTVVHNSSLSFFIWQAVITIKGHIYALVAAIVSWHEFVSQGNAFIFGVYNLDISRAISSKGLHGVFVAMSSKGAQQAKLPRSCCKHYSFVK